MMDEDKNLVPLPPLHRCRNWSEGRKPGRSELRGPTLALPRMTGHDRGHQNVPEALCPPGRARQSHLHPSHPGLPILQERMVGAEELK